MLYLGQGHGGYVVNPGNTEQEADKMHSINYESITKINTNVPIMLVDDLHHCRNVIFGTLQLNLLRTC